MWSRLLGWLRRLLYRRVRRRPDLDLDCRIDIDRIASTLDLTTRGEAAGRHQLPPAQATGPDDVEREVHAYVHQLMSDLTGVANEKLVHYNTAISELDLNAEQERIANLGQYTTLRLDNLQTEARRALGGLQQEKTRFAAQLGRFRADNGLHQDAEYPDSRLLHYALALTLLLVESLLNGYFFAKGSELGYLGGITQAFLVAALNIVPAFVVAGGVLLRYSRHRAWWWRWPAAVGLALYGAWVVLFNLGVAHFRDFLAIDAGHAMLLASQRFFAAPLGLSDLESWVLWCVGIAFAIAAAVDGYRADDPYPGYGRRQRRLHDMEEVYQQECERLTQAADRVREDFLQELDDLSQRVKADYTHLYNLVEQKRALISQHAHCIQDLVSAGDALVHRYRTANRLRRSTPAPSYFLDQWLPRREYPLLGVHSDDDTLAAQRAIYEAFPAFRERAANEIERLYAGFFTAVQSIDPALAPAPA